MPQDITDPATGGSRLLSEHCATCILAAGDRMHLGPERLRAIIGEALAAGTFVVCHDTLTYGDNRAVLHQMQQALRGWQSPV